ncbi:DUF2621 family protein [Halalkalibacillus halophilus]|uniref:DUF2621 family protein n=1 Tax=Halalkalibacillus halophilus TaxID=392827 RepID=UPI00041EC02E|nr:DUF2621 family protein [Halalkalibacillus halophilus]
MSGIVAILLVIWSFIMLGLLTIGGYFMFRKFLKKLPKEDGKSIIDWEEFYIEETIHLWSDEKKQLLNELVEPVPEIFRDVAKQKIGARIGRLALERKAKSITLELLIEGYILATPKRDHKFLIKRLNEKNIDFTPYQHLLEPQSG